MTVLRTLQRAGVIASRYGRILERKRVEEASCECHGVIVAHFARLRL